MHSRLADLDRAHPDRHVRVHTDLGEQSLYRGWGEVWRHALQPRGATSGEPGALSRSQMPSMMALSVLLGRMAAAALSSSGK